MSGLSRFEISATLLPGLMVIQRKPMGDDRGFLCRFYCMEEFGRLGLKKPIDQINITQTWRKGSVRGLHFQNSPHAETKIVSCIQGEVFDVVVDLRRGSPTFLRWHGEVLSSENNRTLLIPEGFAHGFQALADNCEMLYLHTATYHPEVEGGLNIADPRLGIAWPLPVGDLSQRDHAHPYIGAEYQGITV